MRTARADGVELVSVQGRFGDSAELAAWLTQHGRRSGVHVLPQHPCDLRPTEARSAAEVAARAPATIATVREAMVMLGAWCAFGSAVLDGDQPVAVHILVDPTGQVHRTRRRTVDANTAWSPVDVVDLVANTPAGRAVVLGGADLAHAATLDALAVSGVRLALVTAAIDNADVRDHVPLSATERCPLTVVVANRTDGCDAPGASCIAAAGRFLAGPSSATPRPVAVTYRAAQTSS